MHNPDNLLDPLPLEPLPMGLAALQREAAAGRALPPVADWHPRHCGDSAMRIARDGRWFHEGRPIARWELVRLFSTLLRKDADDFVLVTPGEKLRIAVEDVPFLAVLLEVEGEGRAQNLIFTTNVGDVTLADADHPIRVVTDPQSSEPSPYVHVRAGLEARLSRSVFYQLADLAAPGLAMSGEASDMLGVWSGGQFFSLGQA